MASLRGGRSCPFGLALVLLHAPQDSGEGLGGLGVFDRVSKFFLKHGLSIMLL